MERIDAKIQHIYGDQKRSSVQKYRELIIGQDSLWSLIRYELITLLASWVPGALGLFLRSKLYPRILGRVGRNVIFGVNVTFRHPHKISIGDDVVIDDNCLIDAKGESNKGISIGSGVYIGRNTILRCKDGDIFLEDRVNIGSNCLVDSVKLVEIKQNTTTAAYCYVMSGGTYGLSRTDIPVTSQDLLSSKDKTEIGENVWLGSSVVVMDGVSIGRDTVVGAGAVVTKDLPEFCIATGIPAKVTKQRKNEPEKGSPQ